MCLLCTSFGLIGHSPLSSDSNSVNAHCKTSIRFTIELLFEQFLTRASSQITVECRDAGFGSATKRMMLPKNSSKHLSSQYGFICCVFVCSLLSTS